LLICVHKPKTFSFFRYRRPFFLSGLIGLPFPYENSPLSGSRSIPPNSFAPCRLPFTSGGELYRGDLTFFCPKQLSPSSLRLFNPLSKKYSKATPWPPEIRNFPLLRFRRLSRYLDSFFICEDYPHQQRAFVNFDTTRSAIIPPPPLNGMFPLSRIFSLNVFNLSPYPKTRAEVAPSISIHLSLFLFFLSRTNNPFFDVIIKVLRAFLTFLPKFARGRTSPKSFVPFPTCVYW